MRTLWQPVAVRLALCLLAAAPLWASGGTAGGSALTPKRATVMAVDLELPAVELVRDDGKVVRLDAELNDGRPVALNFVFTSCGTICPVMSQTFSQLEKKLGDQRGAVHLVTITIDPERDTPARLSEYAKKLHAGPEWRFYTSTAEGSVAAQKAFKVYRGDKMDHTPVAFVRAQAGQRWLRVDGFATADELAAELRKHLAAR